MSLAFHVYHPGAKAIFDVTSTLITGEKDAFLVDRKSTRLNSSHP